MAVAAGGDVVAVIAREEGDEGDPDRESVTLFDPRSLPQAMAALDRAPSSSSPSPAASTAASFNDVEDGYDVETG